MRTHLVQDLQRFTIMMLVAVGRWISDLPRSDCYNRTGVHFVLQLALPDLKCTFLVLCLVLQWIAD